MYNVSMYFVELNLRSLVIMDPWKSTLDIFLSVFPSVIPLLLMTPK